MQPAGAMALDMIDNINVSLAGGASRAQKLRAAARAGKAGATTVAIEAVALWPGVNRRNLPMRADRRRC